MCACGCVCVCACACVLSQRRDAVDTFAFGLPWEQRPLPASPSRCEVPVSGLTDKPHLHAHYPVTVSPKSTLWNPAPGVPEALGGRAFGR